MSTPQNGAQSADSETTALLEHGKLHSQESTMSQRCTRYMHATVSQRGVDVSLLLCYSITGLLGWSISRQSLTSR